MIVYILLFVLSGSISPLAYSFDKKMTKIHGMYVGMNEQDFLAIYPKERVRTYRQEGMEEWITVNESPQNIITFYFQNSKVKSWKFNDRPEVIKEYLSEFCSLQGFPIIFKAIERVLMKIPFKDFLNITDRQRPVIFSEVYDSGTARFASSQEFIISENEPPCCSKGFTLIKVGLGLGLSQQTPPIEGVIAHELAHRVLDHIKKGEVSCDAEREANALIKKWGFKKEFELASKMFGQKKGDPVGCQEKVLKK